VDTNTNARPRSYRNIRPPGPVAPAGMGMHTRYCQVFATQTNLGFHCSTLMDASSLVPVYKALWGTMGSTRGDIPNGLER
jgi:hypothetical protein